MIRGLATRARARLVSSAASVVALLVVVCVSGTASAAWSESESAKSGAFAAYVVPAPVLSCTPGLTTAEVSWEPVTSPFELDYAVTVDGSSVTPSLVGGRLRVTLSFGGIGLGTTTSTVSVHALPPGTSWRSATVSRSASALKVGTLPVVVTCSSSPS